MWNQANKKNIDVAGNSDAGGDDKLNFFLCGLINLYYFFLFFKYTKKSP